ncbi:MAG: molybdenum cofactor guanylyltransferase [Chloroflexi bacterium]|nr:molybdenum cofactor guanylyltransferase [Chloroflexota bacterium]
MDSVPEASAAILAGGQGRRLGHDKGAILLGGRPLLTRVAERLAPLTDDLTVVLRAGQELPISGPWRIVHEGALCGGLLAGLVAALEGAQHELVWVVGCDMPFISAALLCYERTVIGDSDVAMPRVPLGLEPLHALYRRQAVASIRALAASGERRLSALSLGLSVRCIDLEELPPAGDPLRPFFNINTASDLARAERLLADR